MFGIPSEMITGLTFLAGLAVAGWSFAIWITKQFSNLKSSFYNKIDSSVSLILNKLEYHERHDDQRFQNINDDIWEIRVRNAAIDGRTIENRETSDSKRAFRP